MKLCFPSAVKVPPRMLVAFSGGADSRLLLDLAVEYGAAHGVAVLAAHLHHGIRGDEADRDEAFCRSVADSYGIPLIVDHVDVPTLAASSGRSIELEARLQRYAFFTRVMQKEDAPVLLTAHNADDQLETLLLRLMRGTGTRGMGGIPAIREIDGGTVIRPLLDVSKAEILAACEARGLAYVTDSTNLTSDATRNRIRHELVPVMESISGKGVPQAASCRLAAAAREDDDALSAIAASKLEAHGKGIPLSLLRDEPPAIANRMIGAAYASVFDRGDGAHSLEAVHLDAIRTLSERAVPHSEITLPGGRCARISDGHLIFAPPREVTPDAAPPASPVPLDKPDTAFGAFIVRREQLPVGTSPDAAPEGYTLFARAYLPPDTPPLSVRARRSGDVILCHGMTKRLKKMMCDSRVDTVLRDLLPLVCIGNGETVLWCPTVGFRDGYKAPDKGMALVLSVYACINLENSPYKPTDIIS